MKDIKASYHNIRPGDVISSDWETGKIASIVSGCVFVNWDKINPEPLPPIMYAAKAWDIIAVGFKIIHGKQARMMKIED